MKKRSKNFLMKVPNTSAGLEILNTVKQTLRRNGIGIRAYGRMKHKRAIFEQNNKTYNRTCNGYNDVSLQSPVANKCYEWAIYITPKHTQRNNHTVDTNLADNRFEAPQEEYQIKLNLN